MTGYAQFVGFGGPSLKALSSLISGSRPSWSYFPSDHAREEAHLSGAFSCRIARKSWPGKSGPTNFVSLGLSGKMKETPNAKENLKRGRKFLSSQAARKYFTGTFIKVFHRPMFAKK